MLLPSALLLTLGTAGVQATADGAAAAARDEVAVGRARDAGALALLVTAYFVPWAALQPPLVGAARVGGAAGVAGLVIAAAAMAGAAFLLWSYGERLRREACGARAAHRACTRLAAGAAAAVLLRRRCLLQRVLLAKHSA